MKKLFLLFIAAGLLISSCSKSDRFETGTFPSDAFKKAIPVHGPVIVVPPDEDGDGDDTEELTAAIDDAEPGTVIKLLEGEYHVGYIKKDDFQGSIIGAGREKTIIILKPPISLLSQVYNNQVTAWWRFIGGKISISDMTMKTPDGFLNDGSDDQDPYYGSDLYCMFSFNNYDDDEFYNPDTFQEVNISRINFLGGFDDGSGVYFQTDHNVLLGVWVGSDIIFPKDEIEDYPLTKGEYVFKDCYFEHFLDGIEGFSLGEDATMTVSGCKFHNHMWPLLFAANYNSRIFITDNIFTDSQEHEIVIGDVINDWGLFSKTSIKPLKRCSFVITGNQFSGASVSSILLSDSWIGTEDPTQRLPMLFTIKGNRFKLSGSGISISALNSQDPVIRNNSFQGTGDIGIYINGGLENDLFGWPIPNVDIYARNVLVLGNNFKGLKTTTAAVVLGDKTMNCTVIGTGNEKVIDDGINNKVTGMKKVPGGYHFGPAIRDNIRMWQGRGHR